ncbi:MAG: endonuclease/exonuclease/phosphatase family protein [Luteimonas sp.]|nr:endonuclease/exonuclease/phosphatase family protein [Luteimonas sp.]
MWRVLLACLLCVAGLSRADDAGAPLRVMGFNVRVPVAADGPDRWEARRDLLVAAIRDAQPDVIGTQELVEAQASYLVAALPGYAWFGAGRRGAQGDAGDEHMGVFYRRAALRLVESGDFWLSDTPDVAGSISWGNLFPRMVTWGLFERVDDGRRFYLLDTHLPYRDEDGPVRVRSVRAILRWIAGLPAGAPVILVGDFNDVPGSGTYRAALLGGLRDARVEAPVREGPEGTFHAFTGVPGRRIDWILHRGLQPRRALTLAVGADGRYPSDHFPVLVEFD